MLLQAICFVFGLVTLIRGKFTLGKGRVVAGPAAITAGAILLGASLGSFALLFLLSFVVNVAGWGWILNIGILAAAIVASTKIANDAFKRQGASFQGGQPGAAAQGQFQAQGTQQPQSQAA